MRTGRLTPTEARCLDQLRVQNELNRGPRGVWYGMMFHTPAFSTQTVQRLVERGLATVLEGRKVVLTASGHDPLKPGLLNANRDTRMLRRKHHRCETCGHDHTTEPVNGHALMCPELRVAEAEKERTEVRQRVEAGLRDALNNFREGGRNAVDVVEWIKELVDATLKERGL